MNREQCDIIASMFDIEIPFAIFWILLGIRLLLDVGGK